MLAYVTLAGAVALDPTHEDELGVARHVLGAVLNPDPSSLEMTVHRSDDTTVVQVSRRDR